MHYSVLLTINQLMVITFYSATRKMIKYRQLMITNTGVDIFL